MNLLIKKALKLINIEKANGIILSHLLIKLHQEFHKKFDFNDEDFIKKILSLQDIIILDKQGERVIKLSGDIQIDHIKLISRRFLQKDNLESNIRQNHFENPKNLQEQILEEKPKTSLNNDSISISYANTMIKSLNDIEKIGESAIIPEHSFFFSEESLIKINRDNESKAITNYHQVNKSNNLKKTLNPISIAIEPWLKKKRIFETGEKDSLKSNNEVKSCPEFFQHSTEKSSSEQNLSIILEMKESELPKQENKHELSPNDNIKEFIQTSNSPLRYTFPQERDIIKEFLRDISTEKMKTDLPKMLKVKKKRKSKSLIKTKTSTDFNKKILEIINLDNKAWNIPLMHEAYNDILEFIISNENLLQNFEEKHDIVAHSTNIESISTEEYLKNSEELLKILIDVIDSMLLSLLSSSSSSFQMYDCLPDEYMYNKDLSDTKNILTNSIEKSKLNMLIYILNEVKKQKVISIFDLLVNHIGKNDELRLISKNYFIKILQILAKFGFFQILNISRDGTCIAAVNNDNIDSIHLNYMKTVILDKNTALDDPRIQKYLNPTDFISSNQPIIKNSLMNQDEFFKDQTLLFNKNLITSIPQTLTNIELAESHNDIDKPQMIYPLNELASHTSHSISTLNEYYFLSKIKERIHISDEMSTIERLDDLLMSEMTSSHHEFKYTLPKIDSLVDTALIDESINNSIKPKSIFLDNQIIDINKHSQNDNPYQNKPITAQIEDIRNDPEAFHIKNFDKYLSSFNSLTAKLLNLKIDEKPINKEMSNNESSLSQTQEIMMMKEDSIKSIDSSKFNSLNQMRQNEQDQLNVKSRAQEESDKRKRE